MKIKVCGMRDRQNIADLVALPIDYVGFIFYDKSPRFVGETFSINDFGAIPSSIKKTGVFVNAASIYISEKINTCKLDCIQLHGNESPEFCSEIREKGVTTIKAFGVNESFDFTILKPYINHCDYFLFDTKAPAHGGTGKKFDWSILDTYTIDKPFFLSGGITIDDVEAIKLLQQPIHCLDINSKFEISPAQKDVELIQRFIKAFKY